MMRVYSTFFKFSIVAVASTVSMNGMTLAQVSVGREPLKLRSDFVGYSLSASPQVSYSDNVLLNGDDDREEDAIASLILSGGVYVDRPKFTGILSGDVQVGGYLNPAQSDAGEDLYDQFLANRNVTGAGTFKFIDNLLYLDVGVAAQQQALGENATVSDPQGAANQQQADAYSWSVSPYLYSKFNNESAAELRYRYTGVAVHDSDEIAGIDNYLNDGETHEVLASYDSGKMLDRLQFSVNGYGNITKETGSDVLPEVEYSQATLFANARYPLSRKVSVIGAVGYDEIDTHDNPFFTDDELSGAFYKAGLLLTPGRKTEARLELGERYGGTWVDGSASYNLSSRLALRGDISRTFQTKSQSVSQSFSNLQSETLGYIDILRETTDLTANQIAGRAVNFTTDLTDNNRGRSGLSASDTASLSIIGNGPRTSFSVTGGYDNSDFGFQTTEGLFLGGQVQRRLSRRTSLYGRVSARQSETSIGSSLIDCTLSPSTDPLFSQLSDAEITAICADPLSFNDKSTTIRGVIGGQYQLGDKVSAFGQIGRTERSSDNTALDYDENTVTVGLRYDF